MHYDEFCGDGAADKNGKYSIISEFTYTSGGQRAAKTRRGVRRKITITATVVKQYRYRNKIRSTCHFSINTFLLPLTHADTIITNTWVWIRMNKFRYFGRSYVKTAGPVYRYAYTTTLHWAFKSYHSLPVVVRGGHVAAFRILFWTKMKAFSWRLPSPAGSDSGDCAPPEMRPFLLFVIIADTILFCFSIACDSIVAAYCWPDSGKSLRFINYKRGRIYLQWIRVRTLSEGFRVGRQERGGKKKKKNNQKYKHIRSHTDIVRIVILCYSGRECVSLFFFFERTIVDVFSTWGPDLIGLH